MGGSCRRTCDRASGASFDAHPDAVVICVSFTSAIFTPPLVSILPIGYIPPTLNSGIGNLEIGIGREKKTSRSGTYLSPKECSFFSRCVPIPILSPKIAQIDGIKFFYVNINSYKKSFGAEPIQLLVMSWLFASYIFTGRGFHVLEGF
ncbi:MAG: hypothetical protein JL50_04920 [Peptococcaceae bacterium BICA1-7]|nr:MAG: hypothetical protein JL50_04920 [Peptococcaceae bacterium BICA1-7]